MQNNATREIAAACREARRQCEIEIEFLRGVLDTLRRWNRAFAARVERVAVALKGGAR